MIEHAKPDADDALPASPPTRPENAGAFAWAKWLLAAWAAASLLFAHGCHGPDEDHELFARFLASAARIASPN